MASKRSNRFCICLAVVLGMLFLLAVNTSIAAANDLNTIPPAGPDKAPGKALKFVITSSTTGGTVTNPDGSYTYTQQVDENSTPPHYSPPSNGGGFEIYSWYNQDYGWMHDFPAWDTPGLTIQSAKLMIRAWDIDSEVWHGADGEYDGLSVDGIMLDPGYLQGFNAKWSETTFDIPITRILDDGIINVWLNIDMNHDYLNWATTLNYSLLTITYRLDGNNPPYQPVLSIMPPGAVYDNDNLAVSVVGPTPADPDEDSVNYEYRWFVDVGNGFFVDDEFAGRGDHTGSTVPASDTQVGDKWKVQVTPIDEHGAAGPYAIVTFGAVAEQQKVWYIYSSKQQDYSGAIVITLQDTNGDGKNDKAVVTVSGSAGYYNSIILDVINIGTVPIKISDVIITNNNPSELSINMLESPTTTIKPGRKRAIGIEFNVPNGVQPGTFTFTVSL